MFALLALHDFRLLPSVFFGPLSAAKKFAITPILRAHPLPRALGVVGIQPIGSLLFHRQRERLEPLPNSPQGNASSGCDDLRCQSMDLPKLDNLFASLLWKHS